MKKLYTFIGVAGMLFATNLYAAYDGTMTLSKSAYSSGVGGEFTADTSGLGTFQTFCIEYNEEFLPGDSFDYNENTGAVAGGKSGQDATDPNTGLSMDNISIGTAWLYSQFRAGTLQGSNGHNYATSGNARKTDAGVLQNAIWYLEGEITTSQANNIYIKAAENALTLTLSGLEADSGGAYGVIALNLFNGKYATKDDGYNLNQDQLAIDSTYITRHQTPVPEPTTALAGALLLLPFGVGALRILRKKQIA